MGPWLATYQRRAFSPWASQLGCSQLPTYRWLLCSCWGTGAVVENGTTLSPTLLTDNPKKIKSSILSARDLQLPSLLPSWFSSQSPCSFSLDHSCGTLWENSSLWKGGIQGIIILEGMAFHTPWYKTKSAHTGTEKSQEEPCASSLLPSTIIIKHWNYIYLVAESEK